MWLRLYRKREVIHSEDLFGICNRNDPNQRVRNYNQYQPIVNLSQEGDVYKIYGRSGGGGGHDGTSGRGGVGGHALRLC